MNSAPQSSPVAEGDVIDGKYRVDRVLGLGGMGIVVAAVHIQLEQRVALKFLLPSALSHADVVARFAREARSAVKIQSEHVAKVHDVGTLGNGAPYIVMEYLEGEDLERALVRVGPHPISDAVDYVLQACEAVAEAHSHGIVHRDLKPANLFLATRPNGRTVVKVLDFGISKSTLSTADAALTKTSAVMGSPLYMSPEQMASARQADVRSDIWSLGVILYELLVQRLPFKADTMPELVVAVLHRSPDPLRAIRADVPEALDAAVLRCLEKDPARRFPNVGALAAALAPFGRDHAHELVERISHSLASRPSSAQLTAPTSDADLVAPTVAAASLTTAPWQSSVPTSVARSTRRARYRRAGMAGAFVLVVIGAFAIGVMSRTGRVDGPDTAATGRETSATRPAQAASPALNRDFRAEPPSTGEPSTVAGPPSAESTRPVPAAPPTPDRPPRAVASPPMRPAAPTLASASVQTRPSPPASARPRTVVNPLDLKLQN